MTAMRSLSLTRSSSAPRIRVTPSAAAAAMKIAGKFIDRERYQVGRHVDTPQSSRADRDVSDRFAADFALARQINLRTHHA